MLYLSHEEEYKFCQFDDSEVSINLAYVTEKDQGDKRMKLALSQGGEN